MSLAALRTLCEPDSLSRPWPAPRGNDAQAAVLVPFLVGKQGLELLYTVRPRTLRAHPGQVAFPGGKRDAGETTPAITALREAHEELGLQADQVELLGVLRPLPTFTGFSVTPVLALLPMLPDLTPSPAEVESVFTVPLTQLADPRERRQMKASWNRRDPLLPLHFWPYTPTPIWGMTAHLTSLLLAKLHHLNP